MLAPTQRARGGGLSLPRSAERKQHRQAHLAAAAASLSQAGRPASHGAAKPAAGAQVHRGAVPPVCTTLAPQAPDAGLPILKRRVQRGHTHTTQDCDHTSKALYTQTRTLPGSQGLRAGAARAQRAAGRRGSAHRCGGLRMRARLCSRAAYQPAALPSFNRMRPPSRGFTSSGRCFAPGLSVVATFAPWYPAALGRPRGSVATARLIAVAGS